MGHDVEKREVAPPDHFQRIYARLGALVRKRGLPVAQGPFPRDVGALVNSVFAGGLTRRTGRTARPRTPPGGSQGRAQAWHRDASLVLRGRTEDPVAGLPRADRPRMQPDTAASGGER